MYVYTINNNIVSHFIMVYTGVHTDKQLNTFHNELGHWGQFVDIELRYISNTSLYNNRHRTTKPSRMMRSESSSKELNIIHETNETDETEEAWYIDTYGTKQISHTPLMICPFETGTGFLNLMLDKVLGLFGNKPIHIG